MKACEAIVPATSRPPKSGHSFLRHIIPFCQKRDEVTWERVAGWTNRHGTIRCINLFKPVSVHYYQRFSKMLTEDIVLNQSERVKTFDLMFTLQWRLGIPSSLTSVCEEAAGVTWWGTIRAHYAPVWCLWGSRLATPHTPTIRATASEASEASPASVASLVSAVCISLWRIDLTTYLSPQHHNHKPHNSTRSQYFTYAIQHSITINYYLHTATAIETNSFQQIIFLKNYLLFHN